MTERGFQEWNSSYERKESPIEVEKLLYNIIKSLFISCLQVQSHYLGKEHITKIGNKFRLRLNFTKTYN